MPIPHAREDAIAVANEEVDRAPSRVSITCATPSATARDLVKASQRHFAEASTSHRPEPLIGTRPDAARNVGGRRNLLVCLTEVGHLDSRFIANQRA